MFAQGLSGCLSQFLCCAILRGLASRCSRDANPRRMANATFFLFFVLCHSAWAGVPLFTGRQPSQNGQCHFFPVFCVVQFCEGCFLCCAMLRVLASRCLQDANPRRMANATFCLFFVLCHSAWVGVPLFTGRPPSQVTGCKPTRNGQWHVFLCFWCCAILSGLASRWSRDANPHRMASSMFFPVSGVVPFCEC